MLLHIAISKVSSIQLPGITPNYLTAGDELFTINYAPMSIPTMTRKIKTMYVAYAPEFDVSAYGTCQDEALNNLADELNRQQAGADLTGYEGISHANG